MPGTDYAMICDDVDVRAPKTRYKHHLATSTPTMREAFRAAAARWRHLYIRAAESRGREPCLQDGADQNT